MKTIVLSLFILAVVFAGCEKEETQLIRLKPDSINKSELAEIETMDSLETNPNNQNNFKDENNHQNLWKTDGTATTLYPLYYPWLFDSVTNNQGLIQYWDKSPYAKKDTLVDN